MTYLNNQKKDGPIAYFVAVVKRLIGYKYYIALRDSAEFKKVLKLNNNQKKFERIFNKNLWGDPESVSGAGSTIVSTERFRKWLIESIPKLKVNKIVDAPCGDFHWMQHVIKAVNVDYFGFDIVPALINANSKIYGSKKVTFEQADICINKLPDCDLLIVRDCLFHFSFEDIDNFLANIHSINYRYLITSNYKVRDDFYNTDIITADFRVITLFKHPFNFKKEDVFDAIYEGSENGIDRELLVFEKEAVPKKLGTYEPLNLNQNY